VAFPLEKVVDVSEEAKPEDTKLNVEKRQERAKRPRRLNSEVTALFTKILVDVLRAKLHPVPAINYRQNIPFTRG